MRRVTLLLTVMATALLVASGVAWAGVTKTCPPAPEDCLGTRTADVLKSTSRDNEMFAKAGGDTYTNFAFANFGKDIIADTSGTDKLMLTNYPKRGAKFFPLDLNENGNPDSVLIEPGRSSQHWVAVLGFFADTAQLNPGPGFIESIRFKDGTLGAMEEVRSAGLSKASEAQTAEVRSAVR